MRTRGPHQRRDDARLSPEHQRRLRAVIARYGKDGACRKLGTGITTLEKLDGGGSATMEAVARIRGLLDAEMTT